MLVVVAHMLDMEVTLEVRWKFKMLLFSLPQHGANLGRQQPQEE